ncbi:MAG: hypothetical protein F6K35_36540 [Okeania sp. SIO2H7]|nr:hypothetical protein [Okeania sp. SIO2H7]
MKTTTKQPINPWNYKPWWCQPWSILLTGIVIISSSWFLLKIWWITALVAFPILLWWSLFLILWPRLINLEMENGE